VETSRAVRNGLKRVVYRAFRAGQYIRWDVLPRHFYSSIPDFRELEHDPRWKKPMSMTGVAGTDVDDQLRFVRDCFTSDVEQRLAAGELYDRARVRAAEAGYGPVEAEMLYAFACTHRPRRVVQVGSGFSTAVLLLAADETGWKPDLCCVEPYPSDFLRRSDGEGRIRLLPQRAQEVDLDVFTSLEAGDLLFIDSTHTVKVGSEVNYLVLEALPRLRPGVFVHFHDIFFPYDYNRSLMRDCFFPTESTLLHAFLVGNRGFTIRAAMSMLHYARQEPLQAVIPRYRPDPDDEGLSAGSGHFPSALYLQVVEA
jgi:predicted O-methyltransferase YrrM